MKHRREIVLGLGLTLVFVGCSFEERVESDIGLEEWVESLLNCVPHTEGTCEKLPSRAASCQVEGVMRWRRVLHVEEGEEDLRTLAIREGRWRGGPHTVWSYRFSRDGTLLDGSCFPDIPRPGTPLGSVRMPEGIRESRLLYRDRCTNYNAGSGHTFVPWGDELESGSPFTIHDFGHRARRTQENNWLQGLPQTLRSATLDMDYLPLVLPLSGQSTRVLSLEGEGWKAEARIAELLHLLRVPHDDIYLVRRTVYERPRSCEPFTSFGLSSYRRIELPPEVEAECRRLDVDRVAISSHWIDWIRQKEAQGEAEARPLLQSDKLDGHTIGLGLESKLLLEVDGVPLTFETQRSAGVRLIFDGGLAMDAAWRDFGELLRADGVEAAVIAAPPWYLAGDRLYRVEEAGAALACERVEVVDACSGKCSEARKVAADFDGSSLYLPWAGGVKVGRCVEGGKG